MKRKQYTAILAPSIIMCVALALIFFPALKRMLSETRPAPVWGSPESMESIRYKYRLCDYALFFLEKMQGNTNFVTPLSADGRDSSIKEILK